MKWWIWVWMNVEWFWCGVFKATILELTRKSWENSRKPSVWIAGKAPLIPTEFFQNANLNCSTYTDLFSIFCIAWDAGKTDKHLGVRNTMTVFAPSRCSIICNCPSLLFTFDRVPGLLHWSYTALLPCLLDVEKLRGKERELFVLGGKGFFSPKNSVVLVRKRTIPTERPQPVGEFSANFSW
jgi:hypothetical protein